MHNSGTMMVTGDQIQVMVPNQPPAVADPAALAAYEELLTGASRLVIRTPGCGCRCNPTAASLAIDVDGAKGGLLLEVTPPASVRDPYFSTELKLADGRVVMSLARTGYPMPGDKAPVVVSMDREGPVSIQEISTKGPCTALCDPIGTMPRTTVAHPQSADEPLRRGHELSTPKSLNGAMDLFAKCVLVPLACLTCCAGPVCLVCCVPPPNVHNEMSAVGAGGDPGGGPRYTQKHHTFIKDVCVLRGLPDGDTIVFPQGTPLQMRKDMLTAAAYRLSIIAMTPNSA
jgi:hypothetical protein